MAEAYRCDQCSRASIGGYVRDVGWELSLPKHAGGRRSGAYQDGQRCEALSLRSQLNMLSFAQVG